MKSLFNKALFREQLKRFWPLSAFYFLFYFFFVIIPGISYYSFKGDFSYSPFIGLNMTNPIVLFNALLLPVVIVPRLFSYLFKPKESVTVLAYPIKRDSLWFTNVLAGFVIIIAPLLITYICSSLLFLFSEISPTYIEERNLIGKSSVEIFLTIKASGLFHSLINILLVFLIFAFDYAVCLLAAHICGNAVIYALLSFFLPLIPTGITLIGTQLGQYYTFGIEFNGEVIQKVFTYTNPIFVMANEYRMYYIEEQSNTGFYFIIIFIVTLILFAISFLTNRIRKQEQTGESVVFRWLKNVLIFIITLFGMFLGANFFAMLYRNTLGVYIGICVGFIISYYIGQMIAEKSLNIFKKASFELYKFFGCAALVFVVILLITKFDMLGFQSYTPNPNEVESVSFSSDTSFYTTDASLLNRYVVDDRVTDKTIINNTIAAHKNIIQNKDQIKNTYLSGSLFHYSPNSRDYNITYKLKNGKIIRRLYNLTDELLKETGLSDLLSNEIVLSAKYPYLQSPETIDFIEATLYKDGQNKEFTIEGKEKIKSFIVELKKDLVVEKKHSINNSYSEATGENLSYIFIIDDYNYKNHIGIGINNNTVEWLKQNGYADLFE